MYFAFYHFHFIIIYIKNIHIYTYIYIIQLWEMMTWKNAKAKIKNWWKPSNHSFNICRTPQRSTFHMNILLVNINGDCSHIVSVACSCYSAVCRCSVRPVSHTLIHTQKQEQKRHVISYFIGDQAPPMRAEFLRSNLCLGPAMCYMCAICSSLDMIIGHDAISTAMGTLSAPPPLPTDAHTHDFR